MYIRYYTRDGKEYANLQSSSRTTSSVSSAYKGNLGRVIDKDKGIFKNRERGYFHYDLKSGYSTVTAQEVAVAVQKTKAYPPEPPTVPDYGKEKRPLDFGDAFFLDRYLKDLHLSSIIKDLVPEDSDTVMSLVFYRILTDQKACLHAETWWRGSYASVLFPKANLTSQHISLLMENLGSEPVQKQFFEHYITLLYGKNGSTGILIDSTGLVNASKMQITQISNHNGDVNLEIRLIYVIDRRNGMPIYFRYVQGNIIDISTMITTVNELKQYDINIDYAIMDAGYFSEDNIREHTANHVPYISRLAPNRTLFKDMVGRNNENIQDLMSARYAVKYGNRLVYIKQFETTLYDNRTFVYVGIDANKHYEDSTKVMLQYLDDGLPSDEIDQQMLRLGLFVIVSSENLKTTEVLPLYYTRQQIEQVFDVTKNYADILPIRVENEMTFRGHLLCCFIATIVMQKLQRAILSKRKKADKLNPFGAFMELRNQKCRVFPKAIIPYEADKKCNEVYSMFEIEVPKIIELPSTRL